MLNFPIVWQGADMKNAHHAVWSALAGDALALGVHWMYDVSAIKRLTRGELSGFREPGPSSYHPGKHAGDFTHYGDQTLWLLEFMATHPVFDPAAFMAFWRSRMVDYRGYIDAASRRTLNNLDAGWDALESGSNSLELAGAVRFAGLLPWYGQASADELAEVAIAQTKLTHNQPQVLACADFLARLAAAALAGQPVPQTVVELGENRFRGTFVGNMVAKGVDSVDLESVDAIVRLGQTCHADEALPSVVHLLMKYAADPARAMIVSSMAGGDSAARNMAVGLVLGSVTANQKLPQSWLNSIRAHATIEAALAKAP